MHACFTTHTPFPPNHVRGTGPGKPAAAAKPAAAEAPPPPPPVDEDPKARLEKEIRKFKKKMRECEPLSEKAAKGEEALTAPEQEKLRKLPGWQKELEAHLRRSSRAHARGGRSMR
jgi:hypothetical protein